MASVQLGAAFAKHLFGVVPPTTMTWLRLASSALALVALRPLLRRRTRSATGRRNWPIGLGYAACLVGMNWSIYQAFARIPLGVAVTLEFLGPLAVAVAGARSARHLLWAALAAAGVVLLEWSPAHLDPRGVVFALVAASCWAGYILFGGRAGHSWPGLDVLTLACVLGAVALAGPALHVGGAATWRPAVLMTGLAVGLLSSVIPYGLELFALRSIAPRVFGILMSLEPVAAALAALIVLGEHLGPIDIVAMGCIVVASIGAARGTRAT
ncbi:MAG: EamA family transporter [Propionibacterium sp.]|nr:EamA family transporter [Propionibacterium sp.]